MNIWWLLTALNKLLGQNDAMNYLDSRLAIINRNQSGVH